MTLQKLKRQLVTLPSWQGWCKSTPCPENKLPACENLAAGSQIASRPARGLLRTVKTPLAMLAGEELYTIHDGKLYFGQMAVEGLSFANSRERKMVRLGNYLLIWPDKLAVNLYDPSDRFSLTATFSGTMTASYCDEAGETIQSAAALPESAAEEQRLVVAGEPFVFRAGRWNSDGRQILCRLTGTGLGKDFLAGDGVDLTLGGIAWGPGLVKDVQENTVVLEGLLPKPQEASGILRRSVPDLDLVQEWGGRVFGCRYIAGARNSLYACAQGNPRNWVWGDAWQSDRGEAGPWTGAASIHGCPVFFKERAICRIYPDEEGNHRVDVLDAPGVAAGSEKSASVYQGRAYYLSPDGVMMYDGSFPEEIGLELGGEKYQNGVGACCAGEYYLSAMNSWLIPQMLVYDIRRGVWRREDNLQVSFMAVYRGSLYLLDAAGRLWTADGSDGTPEDTFYFSARLPKYQLTQLQRRQLVAVDLHLELEGEMDVSVDFDSMERFTLLKTLDRVGTYRVRLWVPRRRADHFQLILDGKGRCRIYAMGYLLEEEA